MVESPPATGAAGGARADAAEDARALVEAFLRGDAAAVYDRLDANAKGAISRDGLARASTDLSRGFGAFQRVDAATAARSGEDEIARVRAVFANGAVDFVVKRSASTRAVSTFVLRPAASDLAASAAPPPYADARAFEERDVRVAGLPATLTMPRGGGAHAAVVLVHGSGPHDRDESIGAQRPFRDLAWGLASRGIAVLRYEKRTYGANAQTLPSAARITIDDEVVSDAVAAVRLLAREPGVDPKRTFVLGHSLGAMMAPRIAEEEPSVAGLVLLAPPARPLEDAILAQSEGVALVSPEALDALRAQVARVKSPDLSAATPSRDLPFHLPATYWLSLRGYDPVARAKGLGRPILALRGARDAHVTAEELVRWRSTLDPANAEVDELDGLNHLFSAGADDPPAYLERAHVDARVIDRVARWIDAVAKRRGAFPAPAR